MNVTKHFKERYCERVLDIKNKTEAKQYIAQNEEQLLGHIKKLKEHARFIWKGQLGDNITRNYYIRDDIILVADTDNTALVTCYKCDFKFPEDTNRKVIKDLLEEIEKLNADLEIANLSIKEETDAKQLEIENNDVQIKALEKQLELLKFRQNVLKDELKVSVNQRQYFMEEIKKYAVMLCNSIDYKNDLNELKNRG